MLFSQLYDGAVFPGEVGADVNVLTKRIGVGRHESSRAADQTWAAAAAVVSRSLFF